MNDMTMPSTVRPSALPDSWVDRLFMRFSTMYGKAWHEQWNGVPMEEVKATWAEDLAPYSADQLRAALDHVKQHNKFPPSCPEFVGLCRAYRKPEMGSAYLLPGPRKCEIAPEVRAEIAKFLTPNRHKDPKDWARRILADEANGIVYPLISGKFAREALDIK